VKKFLCVCEGGVNRSVALAFVLKAIHGHDALATGWRWTSPETMQVLCQWADHIFVMQGEFREKIPADYREKVLVADVGPDVYGFPLNPTLQGVLQSWAKDWAERGWEFSK
jgi:hypothetical protein